MSSVKVAINGFGRIGRLVYRQIHDMEGIDVVSHLLERIRNMQDEIVLLKNRLRLYEIHL